MTRTTRTGTSTGATYSYRADGQRVEKAEGAMLSWVPGSREISGHYDTNYATNRPTSRYFYDGQMGFEDDYNPSGTVTKVNRYALGARGIDRVEVWDGTTTTYGYPLYDGHGNMRTTLARSGSSYSTGTFKTYDVWGTVRSGGDSSDPKQKYVANLGHVPDDETGLTYMRARYYEPGTGRFVSQDPAMDKMNWFIYCGNNPANLADQSGESPQSEFEAWVGSLVAIIGIILMGSGMSFGAMNLERALAEWRNVKACVNVLQHQGFEGGEAWIKTLFEADNRGGLLRSRSLSKGLGSALLGYAMYLWGMAAWALADTIDPNGRNLGIFEFMGD